HHLQGVAAARCRAHPRGDAEGIDHADDDHRHVAAVLVRHELPAHQPVDGRMDRRHAPLALGSAGRHPRHGDRARFLPAARLPLPRHLDRLARRGDGPPEVTMNDGNIFAALRAAFPHDLDSAAVETDTGLVYSWRDLDRATAMIANLLRALALPEGSRIAVQV